MKNCSAYTWSADLSLVDLADKIEEFKARPCGAAESATVGFGPILDNRPDELLFSIPELDILCVEINEKVVPGSAIKEALNVKVTEIEAKEQRKLSGRERTGLKFDVFNTLLENALQRRIRTLMVIDKINRLILVDTASWRRAEIALTLLRKTLGSLPVIPLSFNDNLDAYLMTIIGSRCKHADAITYNIDIAPDIFAGDELLLKEGSASIARLKGVSPYSEEVQEHLDSGKLVKELRVFHNNNLSCTLTSENQIKRIKLYDVINMDIEAQRDDSNTEENADKFQNIATVRIIVGAIVKFIQALGRENGGIHYVESAKKPEEEPLNEVDADTEIEDDSEEGEDYEDFEIA